MLPAHPPHSRRISPTRNDTDSTCVCSGRMWRANRSGKTMIVSSASDPQTSVRGAIVTCGVKTAKAVQNLFQDLGEHAESFTHLHRDRSRERCAAGAATQAELPSPREAALPNARL